MNGLSIPPRHWIPPARLLLWLNIGNLGWKETEIDNITFFAKGRLNDNVNGTAKFLTFTTLALEIFLSVKFLKGSDNINENIQWPIGWVTAWIAVIIFCCSYFVILRIRWNKHIKKINIQRTELTS